MAGCVGEEAAAKAGVVEEELGAARGLPKHADPPLPRGCMTFAAARRSSKVLASTTCFRRAATARSIVAGRGEESGLERWQRRPTPTGESLVLIGAGFLISTGRSQEPVLMVIIYNLYISQSTQLLIHISTEC